MKTSTYKGLKTGLDKLTEWSDTLRAVFATGPDAREHFWFPERYKLLQANQNWVTEIAGLMDSSLDDFVDENQARADRGLGITTDGRALYDAMSRFLDVTDTPIKRLAHLYDDVRTRCRDWMGRLVTWFPGLIDHGSAGDHRPDDTPAVQPPGNTSTNKVESFKSQLLESDAYTDAVNCGNITKPFTWNKTINELAEWLIDYSPLPTYNDRNGIMHGRWSFANLVFSTIGGKQITSRMLTEAARRNDRNGQ